MNRIDYVSWVVRNNEREVNEILSGLIDVHCVYGKDYKHFSLGLDVLGRPGTLICVWGTRAHDAYLNVVSESNIGSLSRLDYRYEICAVEEGQILLKELTKGVTNGVTSKYSYTVQSSPLRSKKEGRDGGGKGVRVGSYKSDRSFKVYMRGKEGLVSEFTLADAALTIAVEEARLAGTLSTGFDLDLCQRALISELDREATLFAMKCLNLTHKGAIGLTPPEYTQTISTRSRTGELALLLADGLREQDRAYCGDRWRVEQEVMPI